MNVVEDFVDIDINIISKSIKENGWVSIIRMITEDNGLIRGDSIKSRIESIILRKLGFVPTLEALYQFTGKHFQIITTELPGSERVIDHLTDPKLSCADAVMFSSTVPFILKTATYGDKKLLDG